MALGGAPQEVSQLIHQVEQATVNRNIICLPFGEDMLQAISLSCGLVHYMFHPAINIITTLPMEL